MSTENMKKMIVDLVNQKQGVKATELVAEFIASWYISGDGDASSPVDLLNELVKSGDLVEVEYVLPTMNYRTKSLYFPKGTKIALVSPEIDIPDERQIKDDEELFRFLDLITSVEITPTKDPHAGAKNGKDLIRVKSIARKISDYIKAKAVTK